MMLDKKQVIHVTPIYLAWRLMTVPLNTFDGGISGQLRTYNYSANPRGGFYDSLS
jgi:hypothetical protein